MKNHVKYRDPIYSHEQPSTTLRLGLKRATDATLKLRHPGWSRNAIVSVDGMEGARSTLPGRYIDLTRTSQEGKRVELLLTMTVAAEPLPAEPGSVAFT